MTVFFELIQKEQLFVGITGWEDVAVVVDIFELEDDCGMRACFEGTPHFPGMIRGGAGLYAFEILDISH